MQAFPSADWISSAGGLILAHLIGAIMAWLLPEWVDLIWVPYHSVWIHHWKPTLELVIMEMARRPKLLHINSEARSHKTCTILCVFHSVCCRFLCYVQSWVGEEVLILLKNILSTPSPPVLLILQILHNEGENLLFKLSSITHFRLPWINNNGFLFSYSIIYWFLTLLR